MTNKILISRELLDEFRRYTEAGVPQQGSWGHDLLQKLRAALSAPQQEAVAWQHSAAEVIASFVHLSAKPNPDEWALVAVDAIRLLNIPPAHPAPSVPEGWQLVPKEPTREMLHAGWKEGWFSTQELAIHYKAMLSAAPKAPTTDDRKDAERWRKARDADPDSGEPYLVRQRTDSWGNWRDEILLGDDADAAIDAAIAAQKGEKE